MHCPFVFAVPSNLLMLTLAENTSHIIATWTRPASPNGVLMYNLTLMSTDLLTGGVTTLAGGVILAETMFTYSITLEFHRVYEVSVLPFTSAGAGNGLVESFNTGQGGVYFMRKWEGVG